MHGFVAEVTASTVEVVEVSDLKDHLRISTTAEDDYLQTVRDACAGYLLGPDGILNRAEGLATYRLDRREFADCMTLPLAPFASVESVVYVDSAGTTQLASTGLYNVNASARPARIERADGQYWPTDLADRFDAVRVTFKAGSSDAAAAPADVKHLIKLLAAHFYQNREPVVVGSIAQKIPATFDMLIDKATVRY